MKTSELIGPALDWAVARCEDPNYELDYNIRGIYKWNESTPFSPSTNWAQGGPIIEEHEITIRKRAPYFNDEKWEALGSITAKGAGYGFTKGPTPLIAAMRLYVEANLGKEVEIPEDLQV